jgi:hypothetical protein
MGRTHLMKSEHASNQKAQTSANNNHARAYGMEHLHQKLQTASGKIDK